MALKDLKTNAETANAGVWVNYGANADGTETRFLLSRMGTQNKKYSKAVEAATRPYRRALELGTLQRSIQESIMMDVFCDVILLGWENVQPEDDGKAIPFSKAAAKKLLGDPDWTDLYDRLREDAQNAQLFREEKLELEAKN